MQPLIEALEHPFDWDFETLKDQGTISHANGAQLSYIQEYAACFTFFRPATTGSWAAHKRSNPLGKGGWVMQDPKPVFMPPKPLFFLQLCLPSPTKDAFGQAMNRHVGPLCWARIRALMMAASLEWNGFPGYWLRMDQDERLDFDDQGGLGTRHLHSPTLLGPIFEQFQLAIFEGTKFIHPESFALGDPQGYSHHQRLEAQTAWDQDFEKLPPWIQKHLNP